ncbi:MAG TPA: hypothetical protein VH575_01215 [Gemmataceae bacterium]
MRRAKLGSLALLLLGMGLLAAAAPTPGRPAFDKSAARTIKYADLGKMVRAQRGKVVLVDFWSVY